MNRRIGALVCCCVMASSASAEPTYEVNKETRSQSLQKDALAVLVISGVTLAASAGFIYAAQQKSDEITHLVMSDPWPDNIGALERDGRRLSNLGTLTGVVGAGFAVTAGILYWQSRVARSEERARVTIAPTVSDSSAGVALGGRF